MVIRSNYLALTKRSDCDFAIKLEFLPTIEEINEYSIVAWHQNRFNEVICQLPKSINVSQSISMNWQFSYEIVVSHQSPICACIQSTQNQFKSICNNLPQPLSNYFLPWKLSFQTNQFVSQSDKITLICQGLVIGQQLGPSI